MTPEQLADLVRHLHAGVTVSFNITVEEAKGPPDAIPDAVSVAPPRPDNALTKVAECAEAVRLPERELRRATKAGFLDHEIKRTGRDAGAVMLRILDVRAYSERRERIKRGEEPAPEGWTGPPSTYA